MLRFAGIPPTTWRELLDGRLIKPISPGVDVYRLTGSGWWERLRSSGHVESGEVQRRCGELARALKSVVDRYSHADAIVALDEIAIASSTSKAWCFNALQSGLLEAQFSDKRMTVRIDYPLVYVPPHFGQTHLTMFTSQGSSNAIF